MTSIIKADPKAIAARQRDNGKFPASVTKATKNNFAQSRASEWRESHGLETGKKTANKKQKDFA